MKRYPITRNGELVGSLWCNDLQRVQTWIASHNHNNNDTLELVRVEPDCVSSLIVVYHDLETNETEVGSYN